MYDEVELHERMDEYKQLFKSKKFTTEVVYASKAFLVPELCNIVNEHGLWMDAVSIGDLFIAFICTRKNVRLCIHKGLLRENV